MGSFVDMFLNMTDFWCELGKDLIVSSNLAGALTPMASMCVRNWIGPIVRVI